VKTVARCDLGDFQVDIFLTTVARLLCYVSRDVSFEWINTNYLTMQSPYTKNAFFLLDLSADCSLRDVYKTQRKLEVAMQMGETNGPSVLSFLQRPQLNRENILDAVHRLENGPSRVKEEIFWLHAGQQKDCLPQDRLSAPDLIGYLSKKASEGNQKGAIAKHNLAVAYHALAFESERNRGATLQFRRECWQYAYRYWRETYEDDRFWEFLIDRVDAWNDPTVSDGDIDQERRVLPEEILRFQGTMASEHLYAKDPESAKLHLEMIQSNAQWIPSSPVLVNEIAASYVRDKSNVLDRILSIVNAASLREKTNEERESELGKVERDIVSAAKDSLAYLNVLGGSMDNSNSLEDHAAKCLHNLSVRYFELLENAAEALRLLKLALQFARTPSVRATITADRDYLEYLKLCNEAAALVKENKYEAAADRFAQILKIVPESEKENIEKWLETCHQNQILEGVDTTKNSPSLYTLNGIGATFYGKRDYDSVTNSYVTNHFFTIFFIPVLPIGAYRVIDAGERSYKILGKVPLSNFTIWYRRIVVVLGCVFVLLNSFQRGNSDLNNGNLSPTPTEQHSPQVNTENSATANYWKGEKQEIEQLRGELKQRQEHLKEEERAISDLADQIKQLKESVKTAESIYGTEMPEDIRLRYSNEINRHNSVVSILNGRLATYRTESQTLDRDLEEFNQRVTRYNSRQ